MTTLLQQAFSQAAQLPALEQDALATLLLEEMADEQRWEKSFAQSQDTLAKLTHEALAEFAAGKTNAVQTADDFAHH
jgi:hypothetical protein